MLLNFHLSSNESRAESNLVFNSISAALYVCRIAKVRLRINFGWFLIFTKKHLKMNSLCICAYTHKKWLPILYVYPFCVYMHTYRTQNFEFYMCAYRHKTYIRIGKNCTRGMSSTPHILSHPFTFGSLYMCWRYSRCRGEHAVAPVPGITRAICERHGGGEPLVVPPTKKKRGTKRIKSAKTTYKNARRKLA